MAQPFRAAVGHVRAFFPGLELSSHAGRVWDSGRYLILHPFWLVLLGLSPSLFGFVFWPNFQLEFKCNTDSHSLDQSSSDSSSPSSTPSSACQVTISDPEKSFARTFSDSKMPLSPFPPRPVPSSRQDDPYGGSRSRPPSNLVRPILPQNEAARTPRSTLRPAPPSYTSKLHDPPANPLISRPQPLSILRSTAPSSSHHHHTSSSPELRPHLRPYPQQYPPDLSQTGNTSTSTSTHSSSHIIPRPRRGQDDVTQRRSGFAVRVNPDFVPGIRGRSASEVRIAHTPPPDLEPDRLARACGQLATGDYRCDDIGRQGTTINVPTHCLKTTGTTRGTDPSPSHPLVPKIRIGHMYRRLDALARHSGRRAIDHVNFEDVAVIHRRDCQLREQLHWKRSERLQEMDPSFHAIGAPLEDVLLYASTPIIIGDYQHYLPVVVVACVEELTKTGIYQSGLFRALPSRDRHLQLIDLFDKSRDFGAQFNMRGQAMPDICALLSTFISSLPSPLLDTHIYSALWHWSVKPSVKRDDARRDRQEEEEEDRRARGEPPRPEPWVIHTDIYLDDADSVLETDQISTAQILLRFLPTANLSLLAYLCAFFTQLPLCPENGLQLEDVARIFGHRLLGGSVKVSSRRMMMWLLTRWHRISETLFGETCGMTPPPSPSSASHSAGPVITGDGDRERIEKRKGKRESGLVEVLRHATSSSSSYSSPSTESPEDHGMSSRKSSSDGEEEGESSEGSRQRKKRELGVQEPRTNASCRPSTRKDSRHGHGQGRRGSGSRRHQHGGHSSEHKKAHTSPDPFAMAFAKAQEDLVDAPLLTTPSSAIASSEGDSEKIEATRQFEAPNPQYLDTPVGTARSENARRTGADAWVVDALLQEKAVATDVARVLAERVDILEKALQVRGGSEGGPQCPVVPRRSGEDESKGGSEDELRLQLRRVEAERDRAQQIVRDVRTYLLGEGTKMTQ